MTPNHARAARLRERIEERLSRSPSEHAYPVEDWQIVERRFEPEYLPALESLFAVANGYLGLRGTPEEGHPVHEGGAVLNGFHETWPIVYPEDAYGLARTGQTIVNATDGTIIRLFVDDEPFDLATSKILRFERVLDMQIGVLSREVEFVTMRGQRMLLRSRRLASLEHRHLAAIARGEGLGVPAKGLTGHGYEGHYFWDTEIYVLPFLVHTTAQWAKQVLQFRCGMLPMARKRAAETGHGGALYPWRTINGEEASAWYAAGTAQYHINADIAYAMRQYGQVTGDVEFILDEGAEVLIESARLWMELGFFSERRDGAFCINSVTGPDEYTTVVDNNAYTNLMAKEHLHSAVTLFEWLTARDPDALSLLVKRTGVTEDEVDGWRRAMAAMHVPRHAELGIVLQDEHFLERKRWDFDATPIEKYPLLLHHHPLELYRHQVIKQTDVVLATYLVGHYFSDEEKRRTFDYYDPLTTGDSTLSACIQSVMASEVGYPEAALEYFVHACAVDLADVHANTADGIHIASCGGTWLALVAGFGGLRESLADVCFSPRLPAEWDRLRFRVQVREQLVEVDMTHEGTTYRLVEGRGLLIQHFGEPLRLVPGESVKRPERAELERAA